MRSCFFLSLSLLLPPQLSLSFTSQCPAHGSTKEQRHTIPADTHPPPPSPFCAHTLTTRGTYIIFSSFFTIFSSSNTYPPPAYLHPTPPLTLPQPSVDCRWSSFASNSNLKPLFFGTHQPPPISAHLQFAHTFSLAFFRFGVCITLLLLLLFIYFSLILYATRTLQTSKLPHRPLHGCGKNFLVVLFFVLYFFIAFPLFSTVL